MYSMYITHFYVKQILCCDFCFRVLNQRFTWNTQWSPNSTIDNFFYFASFRTYRSDLHKLNKFIENVLMGFIHSTTTPELTILSQWKLKINDKSAHRPVTSASIFLAEYLMKLDFLQSHNSRLRIQRKESTTT